MSSNRPPKQRVYTVEFKEDDLLVLHEKLRNGDVRKAMGLSKSTPAGDLTKLMRAINAIEAVKRKVECDKARFVGES